MKPRSILRPVPLAVAAAAALVSTACVDRLPSGVTPAVPNAPHATLIPTTPYTAIDGGQTHACGIASGGQIYCWGRNASGQLGDSTAANSSVPVTVYQAGVTFASFSSGAIHNCALTSAGQAYCWGYNGDGRLGDTTFVQPLRPVPVVTNVTFASVSAGNNHTCGLDASGNSYCWGNNAWSQVGDSTTSYAVVPVATHMPAGVTFTQIAAGTNFTCALDGTGQAWCWGYNGYGAVGNNSVLTRRVPGAVIQPAGVTFASVYAEYDYACALDGGGQAYCWGRNDFYQLGDSTTTNRKTPVAVHQPAGVTFTQLALAGTSACGLTSAGQAYCWGNNGNGQLGDGTLTSNPLPVAVAQPSGVTFTSIRAEQEGGCGIDPNGQTWCWGRNSWGQLGDGTTTRATSPVAVSQ